MSQKKRARSGPLYKDSECRLCRKPIHRNGRASHALAHVRRKQAVIRRPPNKWSAWYFGTPYEFDIAPKRSSLKGGRS